MRYTLMALAAGVVALLVISGTVKAPGALSTTDSVVLTGNFHGGGRISGVGLEPTYACG